MKRRASTAECLAEVLGGLAAEAIAEPAVGPMPVNEIALWLRLGLRPDDAESYRRLAAMLSPGTEQDEAAAEGYRAGPLTGGELAPAWRGLIESPPAERFAAMEALRPRLSWGSGFALAIAVHRELGDREGLARLHEALRERLAACPPSRADLPRAARMGLYLRFTDVTTSLPLRDVLDRLSDHPDPAALGEPLLRLAVAAEQSLFAEEALGWLRMRLKPAWQSGEEGRYRATAVASEAALLALRALSELGDNKLVDYELEAILGRLEAFDTAHAGELDRPYSALVSLRAAQGDEAAADEVMGRIRSLYWRQVADRRRGRAEPEPEPDAEPPQSWPEALAAPWHGAGVTRRISPVARWARAAAELPDDGFAVAAGRAWDEVMKLPLGARDGRWLPLVELVFGRVAERCEAIGLERVRRYRDGLAEYAAAALAGGPAR